MKDPKTLGEANQETNGIAKQKKPYLKPQFRYERVFEMQALACGKVHAAQQQCQGLSGKHS
jgi:hypothetical protein